MAAEYHDAPEPKDRTRILWGMVALIVLAMIGAFWYAGRPDRSKSYVHAKHILIPYSQSSPTDRARQLDLVTDLRERIEAGESFEKLAEEYSADPYSAARGGDLGPSERGLYENTFEDYIWNAEVGQVSEVITTNHGFHLIKVVERYISPGDAYEAELEERARQQLEAAEEEARKERRAAPPASIAAPANLPKAQSVPRPVAPETPAVPGLEEAASVEAPAEAPVAEKVAPEVAAPEIVAPEAAAPAPDTAPASDVAEAATPEETAPEAP